MAGPADAVDAPLVLIDQILGDGEAEAGPPLLAGDHGVEEGVANGVGNAGA